MSVIINSSTHPQRGRDSIGKGDEERESSLKEMKNKKKKNYKTWPFPSPYPPPLSNYNSCCATGEFKMLEHNLKWISRPTHFIQDRKSLEGFFLF